MKADQAAILNLLQEQGHLRNLERPKARLKHISLPGVDLSHAHLHGADFSRADLSGADLSNADLAGAVLTGANLSKARLEGAILHKARLRESNLKGANLSGAVLTRAMLIGAELSDAVLDGADLSDADLSRIELVGASFRKVNAARINLSSAELKDADLSAARLEEGFFERSRFVCVRLEDADFTRANLVGFRLEAPTALQGAKFCEADLAESSLDGLSFDGVDLSGAIFDQAHLNEVSFEGASLERTDFQGVTGLSDEQIERIREAGGIVNAVLFEKLFTFIKERRWAQITLALLLLAVGLVVFSYYRNPDYRPVDTLLQEAQELRSDGRPAEALVIYERLGERVKDRLDQEIAVLYEKAETLAELERPEEAAAVYALISSRTSDDPDEAINARLKRADALVEAGNYEEAIIAYRKIADDVTNSPRDVGRALVALSTTYQKMGFEDRALEIFEETLKRFPHDPDIAFDVNLQMAEVYIQRRGFQQARKVLDQLEKMARDDSQRVELLIRRARLFEEEGDKEDSLETFEQLVKRYPESPDVSADVKMDLAQLMIEKGEYNWASRIYREILDHSKDLLLKSQARVAYGTLLRQLGETDKALELFEQVQREAVNNPELQGSSRLEEAQTLALLKRYDEALAVLSESVQDGDPGMVGSALLRRGQLLLEMGRNDEAFQVFKDIDERFGGRGDVATSARMELAMLELNRGNAKKAIGIYEGLLRTPGIGDFRSHILNQLGQAYAAAGLDEEAERTFRSLTAIRGDSEALANGRFGLARLAARRGDLAGATALYRRVVDEVDDLSLKIIALDTLARLYAASGEDTSAIGAYQSILDMVPERHDAAFSARQGMAELYESRRQFAEAEPLYRLIVKESERGEVQAGALLALGRMYLDKGDTSAAVTAFQRVRRELASVGTADFEARLGLAEAYKAEGKVDDAIEAFKSVADEVEDPRLASQALDGLSQLYQESGRADEALAVSRRLLDRANQDQETILTAKLGIASSLRQKGKYEEALTALKELEASTADPNLRLIIVDSEAQTFSAMSDHTRAAEAYEELVRGYQNNQDSLHNAMMGLASSRRGEGRLEDAITLYKKVARDTIDEGLRAWALQSLAETYAEAGQRDKSVATLEKARQMQPGDESNLLARANLERTQGHSSEALELYRQAVRESRESNEQAWALIYSAELLSERNQNDDALENYFKVLEDYSGELEPLLNAKFGIAGIFRARNRLEEAIQRYEDLAKGESFPEYRITAALTAGDLYAEKRKFTKARTLYQRVLTRFPERKEGVDGANLRLARLDREGGKIEEALKSFRALSVEAIDPSIRGAAMVGVARCFVDLGQREQAREAFVALKARYPEQQEWVAEANGYLEQN